MKLNFGDVQFAELSLVDDFGRVFFYNGRVYRAINKYQYDNCLALVNSELFKELMDEGLIPQTYISEFTLDDFPLILEHEKLSESRPHHWSFTMYKEAALLILRVNRICSKYGFELKDGHPYNILFRDGDPVFIDVGSIQKSIHPSYWSAYNQFVIGFYLQLLLWSKKDFFLARKLIEDGNTPINRSIPMNDVLDSSLVNCCENLFDLTYSFKGRELFRSPSRILLVDIIVYCFNRCASFIVRKKVTIFSKKRRLKPQSVVEQNILALKRPEVTTSWGNYHDAYNESSETTTKSRFVRIIELVKKLESLESAIDLAGNQGVFSRLLIKEISLKRMILTDYDEVAVDKAYKKFKEEKIRIETYLFNFMQPVKNEEIYNMRCDVVFALAVLHHLILSQGYILSVVLSRIASYSKKYAVVEFMPLGLWNGTTSLPVPEWYTIDWFRVEFSQYFNIVCEEELERNRILFIGRKIERRIDSNTAKIQSD